MKKLLVFMVTALMSVCAYTSNFDTLTTHHPLVANFINALINEKFYDDWLYKLAQEALRQDSEMVNAVNREKPKNNKDIDMACWASFETTPASRQLKIEILTKSSSKDLDALEQFLQTSTGNKWYLNLLKHSDAMKTDTFYDVYDMNEQHKIFTDVEEQQIKKFSLQHQAFFNRMSEVLDSKKANSSYENFQQSCITYGKNHDSI